MADDVQKLIAQVEARYAKAEKEMSKFVGVVNKKMKEADEEFRKALLASSRVDGNVVVTDFRGLSQIPVGNRFLVYTLFPEATVSVRLA